MLRPLLLWFALSVCAHAAPTVAVSASASLAFALEQLHAAFREQEPKIEVKLTLDKADKLVADLYRGTPCDVFICSDIDHPRDLVRSGKADADSLTVFAVGRLVVWTKRPDFDLANLASLARHPGLKRLAITNAETGPYARAARKALIRSGAWLEALPKIAVADSVMQVAEMVEAGDADAGFISLSLALSPQWRHTGRWHEIAVDPSAPLTQAAVLTTQGRKNRAAQRYLDFLRSPAAKKILLESGFAQPETVNNLGEP